MFSFLKRGTNTTRRSSCGVVGWMPCGTYGDMQCEIGVLPPQGRVLQRPLQVVQLRDIEPFVVSASPTA